MQYTYHASYLLSWSCYIAMQNGNVKRGDHLDEIVEEELKVDKKYHKVFVLRRAQLIRKISQENGGVHIIFPRLGSKGQRVLLQGARKFVNTAMYAILEVLRGLNRSLIMECYIPQMYHESVLGVHGVNVESLILEHNVVIKFPPPLSPPHHIDYSDKHSIDYSDNIVLLKGKRENCLRARRALVDLIPRVLTVPLPHRFHTQIIGSEGRNTRSICSQHGVRIIIPPADLECDFAYIDGSPNDCEKAKEDLLKHLKELQDEELRTASEEILKHLKGLQDEELRRAAEDLLKHLKELQDEELRRASESLQ